MYMHSKNDKAHTEHQLLRYKFQYET